MPPRRHASRRAFTLLEIVLVVALLMMILSIGLPSIRGQLTQKRLQDAFDRFDRLVIEAQKRSVTDHEPYVLVWQKGGAIRLYPVAWDAKQRASREPAASWLPEGSSERYALVRPASLAPPPTPAEWTFWPSGNCEPATVNYSGDAGTWEAAYSPLSGHGAFKSFLAR